MTSITDLSRIAVALLALVGFSDQSLAASTEIQAGQFFEMTRDYSFYTEATLPFVTYVSGQKLAYRDLEKTDPPGSIRCSFGANALGHKRINTEKYLIQGVELQTSRGVDTLFIDFSLPHSADPHREGYFWMCSREQNSRPWQGEDLEATVDHGVRF